MLKRSYIIASMPCLFSRKDNSKREHKGEERRQYFLNKERRQYDTHLKEAEQAQPILVWLDINTEVLDTLKNLTDDMQRLPFRSVINQSRCPSDPSTICYRHG